MSADAIDFGAPRLLQESARGRGNRLLVYSVGDRQCVLKLYRSRQSPLAEALSAGAHRFLERKRGVSPQARCETERQTLETWSRHGFDVFRRLDLPLPPDQSPPATWLEYCPGSTLAEVLRDAGVALDEKATRVARMASTMARRHRLALDLSDPLLLQERGTTKHVLLHGDRMVWFDFEGGFLPGFPILEGLAQELAGHVRSLKAGGDAALPRLLGAFIDGYGDRDLLREIAEWGVHHRGLYRRVRRWYDRLQRGAAAKTEALRQVLGALGAP